MLSLFLLGGDYVNPAFLLLAVGYGYLAGNPKARHATIKQLQKVSGMVVDGFNRRGGVSEIISSTEPTTSKPEQPDNF